MKTLYIVRHAKTEQLDFMSDKPDFERALKPRGHSDTKLIADELIKRSLKPNVIVSSTATRAMQTSELFAKQFNIDKNKIITEQFIYDGYTTSDFIQYINRFESKYDSIMVVGHNPEIAMMAINLCNSDYYDFPTTATVVINFDVDNWKDINARAGKLELFLTPKHLK